MSYEYCCYILSVVVVRAILFALVWLVTFGKHKFWLFPNLTEDCGVIESFIPFYTHEVVVTQKTPAIEKKSEKAENKDGGGECDKSDDVAAAENQDGDGAGDAVPAAAAEEKADDSAESIQNEAGEISVEQNS